MGRDLLGLSEGGEVPGWVSSHHFAAVRVRSLKGVSFAFPHCLFLEPQFRNDLVLRSCILRSLTDGLFEERA